MYRFIRQNGKLLIVAACFSSIWIAVTWVRVNRWVLNDRKATITAAVQRNSNLAVALEQYAIRTIDNADAVLQLVKKEYERVGNTINLVNLLDSNVINARFFMAVTIFDEKGKIIVANIFPAPDAGVNITDRDYFKYHIQHPADSLSIGKPVVSRTLGKAVIPFTRRINKTGGGFGGIVSVQIEPAAFTSFYADANLQPHDFISFIAPDGTTYARRTGSKESYGENISSSPLFVHVSRHAAASYFAKDAIRGIPTYISYRKLKQYPVIATVGAAQEDVLARYHERAFKDRLSTLFIDLMIFLFALAVCFILVGQKRHQRELTKQVILAQEREREVIGGELHDNVNQVLATVRLYLDMALSDKETAPHLISKSMKHLNDCINDLRHISHSLTAPTLGAKSLVDAITSLIEMVSLSSGLHIVFQHDAYIRTLPMDQKLSIYRIMQEQLNNVIRHAHATEVTVNLSQTEEQTFLTIKDNGRGFDAHAKRNGIGLNNITSRAKVFEGKVNIESAPGNGCILRVSIPNMVVRNEAGALKTGN